MPHLTKTRLEAIIEALSHSIMVEHFGDISHPEYEKALQWAKDELAHRQAVATLPPSRRYVRKVVPSLTIERDT